MSVIISGVEMPKSCHDCGAYGINDVVGIQCPCENDPRLYSNDSKPANCPLTEALGREWISIEEKQPKPGTHCIIAATDQDGINHVSSAKWQSKRFYLVSRCAYWHVTHWMPMPIHPEEDG